MNKKSLIKNIFIVIGVCLILFVVANIVTYIISGENVIEYFRDDDEPNLDGIWNQLKKDGKQFVKIDDYTITLEEYLYDGATYKGYAMFSVKREGKDMRKETAGETVIHGSTFGEGERFTFELNGSRTCDTKYKKEKNALYVYYKFAVSEVWGFDSKILLCDYKTHGDDWRKEENAMFEFSLNDNVGTEMYEINDNGVKSYMYVSPFAIKIVNYNLVDNVESLELVFKDYDNKIMVDKNEIKTDKYYGKSSGNGLYAYYILFEESINVKNIKEVNLNGSCLKLLSDTEREEVEKAYDKMYELE